MHVIWIPFPERQAYRAGTKTPTTCNKLVRPVRHSFVMSYNCGVLDNSNCTFSTWSIVIFSLTFILGAINSLITGASFGIIVNWVLDFSQSIFHSNRRKIYPQEVFHRVWTFQIYPPFIATADSERATWRIFYWCRWNLGTTLNSTGFSLITTNSSQSSGTALGQ